MPTGSAEGVFGVEIRNDVSGLEHLGRGVQCRTESGQMTNFVTVNYCHTSSPFDATDTLNCIQYFAAP